MFLKNWARLYSYMTDPEKALEPAVAALGTPYRVQHPFWDLHHFADFVLLERKLVLEVDGKSHDTPAQKIKDLKHTLALQAKGYVVVRCRNEEAMADPSGTVARMTSPESVRKSRLEEVPAARELARLEALVASRTRGRRKAPPRVTSPKGRGRPKKRAYPTLLSQEAPL